MSQTSRIVTHPETGKAVKEVTTVDYVEIERDQLEREVNERQQVLDQANQALNEHNTRGVELEQAVANAQAALEESKSNVSAYDEAAPQPEPEAGSEADSGANENENAEGAVAVPVQF